MYKFASDLLQQMRACQSDQTELWNRKQVASSLASRFHVAGLHFLSVSVFVRLSNRHSSLCDSACQLWSLSEKLCLPAATITLLNSAQPPT